MCSSCRLIAWEETLRDSQAKSLRVSGGLLLDDSVESRMRQCAVDQMTRARRTSDSNEAIASRPQCTAGKPAARYFLP
jgi:hypothetical protein